MTKGAALPNKPPKAQAEELDRLASYLRDAADGYRVAGIPDMAQSIGITARRVTSHALAIRNRIALESSCCRTRAIRGDCSCSVGLP